MRIEHVALYVNDLENTKKFFMKYLGAKSNAGYHNQKTGFYSYFLTFEDGARIEIMNLPEMADLPKKIVRTGYSHIAFSVGSIEIVDALTAELKADGMRLSVDHGLRVMDITKAALLRLKIIKLRLQYNLKMQVFERTKTWPQAKNIYNLY